MNDAQEIIDSCDEEIFDLNKISEGIRLYKQDNVINPDTIRMNESTLGEISLKLPLHSSILNRSELGVPIKILDLNIKIANWDEHIRQEMILNFREQF